MEELDPIFTDPMTLAVGATKDPFTTGRFAPKLIALKDGCTAPIEGTFICQKFLDYQK